MNPKEKLQGHIDFILGYLEQDAEYWEEHYRKAAESERTARKATELANTNLRKASSNLQEFKKITENL